MKFLPSIISLLVINGAACAEVSPARGEQLEYMLLQDCGSCHGLTLQGGLGPALLPENLPGRTRDYLVYTILRGRAGSAMPPWRGLLSEQDAAWMADRLLTGQPGETP
jgi:cytochrome c55X